MSDVSVLNVWDGLSNTRPPNTHESNLKALIDWVSIAFHVNGDFQDVVELLGLQKLEFEFLEWGRDTYTEHIRFSNIVIQKKNDFDYQLSLSGQGCREFEDYSSLNWIQLFGILKEFCHAKATRLDIALDDFKPYYTTNMIKKSFSDGRLITRMRTAKLNEEYDTKTLDKTMNSFYLGSLNSRLSINFYDKKLERESKGFEVTEEFWTRTELRLKREYANDIIDIILLNDNLGDVLRGILKKHMRIIRKSKDTNKSRVSNVRWWDYFLKDVAGIQLSVKAPDKTIERSKSWIEKSVAPTLSAIRESDPALFNQFIIKVLKDGDGRLNANHYRMIEQYKESKYKELVNKIKEDNQEGSLSVNELKYNRMKKESISRGRK